MPRTCVGLRQLEKVVNQMKNLSNNPSNTVEDFGSLALIHLISTRVRSQTAQQFQ